MAPRPEVFAVVCREGDDVNFRSARMTKQAAENLILAIDEFKVCSLPHVVQELVDGTWR